MFTTLVKTFMVSLSAILAMVSSGATTTLAINPSSPNSAAGGGSSRNWAGYVAEGGTFTSVTGTWTVPTIQSSRAQSADATWIGIGGVNTHDLIQSGTQETIQRNGQVEYQSWYELLPRISKPLPVTVKAGDSVTVTINQQSSGQWQISFNNNSTGQNYSLNVNYNSSLSSADWIEEAPASGRGFMPLDNFGSVSFTNASTTKNGNQMNLSAAGAQPISMGPGRSLQASTSTIGSDGSSFTVTRTNNTAQVTPAQQTAPTIIYRRTRRGYGYPSRNIFIPRGVPFF